MNLPITGVEIAINCVNDRIYYTEYITQIMKLEDSLADNGNKMRLSMQ